MSPVADPAARALIIDTETTGLDPDAGDRIIQLAAVEILSLKPTGRSFAARVNPQGRRIQYQSFIVHRMQDRDLENEPPVRRRLPEFAAFVGDGRLIAHNAPFDVKFIKTECERATLTPPPQIDEVEDSIAITRRLWPGRTVSLDAICRRLDISLDARKSRHDALVDCGLLAQAYCRMRWLIENPSEQADLLTMLDAAPAITAPADLAPILPRPRGSSHGLTVLPAFPFLYAQSHFSVGASILSPKAVAKLAAQGGAVGLADANSLAGAYPFSLAAKGAKPVIATRLQIGPLGLFLHAEQAPAWPALCETMNALRLGRGALPETLLGEIFEFLRLAPITVSIDASSPAAEQWAGRDNPLVERALAAVARERLAFALPRSYQGRQGREVAAKAAALGLASIAAPIIGALSMSDLEVANVTNDGVNPPYPTIHKISDDEVEALYHDLPGAVANAHALAERCNFALVTHKPAMPHCLETFDEARLVNERAAAGLELRLTENAIAGAAREPYDERLAFELKEINRLGFSGYFVIVADFINYARRQGIPVGPGRGSGAGSLVAWAMRITDLDPIKLELFFERFINPARVTPPDFDVDFCKDRRDEIVAYLVKTYGIDHVAQIGAWQKLEPRAAWRAAANHFGLTPGQALKISNLIPNKASSLDDVINSEPHLRDALAADVESAEAMQLAINIGGCVSHRTRHPAGVVLSDEPIAWTTPLIENPDSPSGIPATQFDMKSIDYQGLIKFDLLGLKTLTIVERARQNIHNALGVDIDPWAIPYEDDEVFAMLDAGWTINVFQLESAGMTKAIKEIGLSNFEDIVALVALYRPGPMDQIPIYGARKRGKAPITYPHPALADVLAKTYGIPIYQEQIMQLARKLAGYTLGEADLLRRAMGKKIPAEMAALESSFITGCINNEALNPRMDEPQAKEIFAMVSKFAGYGFNRSHAAAYARITWVTAWLKRHYFQAFAAACLDQDGSSSKRLAVTLSELKRLKIPVLPLDVNASSALFTCTATQGGGELEAIRYSLSAIKNVGEDAASQVERERLANGPFASFSDFITRTAGALRKNQLAHYARAGAFDSLYPGQRPELSRALALSELAGPLPSDQPTLMALDAPAAVQPLTPAELAAGEIEALGFPLTIHPTEPYASLVDGLAVRPLKEAIKTAQTLGTDAIVLFVAADDADGRIEAIVEDNQTRLRVLMKPGLMPPAIDIEGPKVARVTFGPKATIIAWRNPDDPQPSGSPKTRPSAHSARKGKPAAKPQPRHAAAAPPAA